MSKKKQSDNLIDALVFIRVLGVGNCSFVRAEDVTERLFVNIKKDPKPQHFGIITKKKNNRNTVNRTIALHLLEQLAILSISILSAVLLLCTPVVHNVCR